MNHWFTVEHIDLDTYVISENRHWEETHCYLVCGEHRAALIDTGLGVSNIKAVVDALTSLPILVLTTHAHWDHIGGHSHFENIGVHEREQGWMTRFPLPLSVVKQNLTCRPCTFPKEFELSTYHLFQGKPQVLYRDGDMFDLGNRCLTVIHTPGHSPGHCCFYEAERGYLFSGDLVYRGCLDAFYPTTDPVQFFHSVEKVQKLEVTNVLPGHHSMDVPVQIMPEIYQAFQWLDQTGQLHHGSGIFSFSRFQIHI